MVQLRFFAVTEDIERRNFRTKVNPRIRYLIGKLAAEDQNTIPDFIERLIQKEDDLRHQTYSREMAGYIRTRCGRPECFVITNEPVSPRLVRMLKLIPPQL